MTWIQTYTGKGFNFLKPDAKDICIEDIAHHLCEIPRFTGALTIRYNVASHCINVARYVYQICKGKISKEYLCKILIEALLHDAAEAYIGDINTPLKRFLGDNIRHLEDNILREIAAKYGIVYPFSNIVKEADASLCAIEAMKLLAHPPINGWHHEYIKGMQDTDFKLAVIYHKEMFINIYQELANGNIEILETIPGTI